MNKLVSATALFAIILWGCTALHVFTRAEPGVPVQAAQTPGDTLTDDSLLQTLVNMGYEPKKLSKGALIVVKQDTWTLNLQVVLSPNAEKVGLNANLGKVDDPDSITSSQWKGLLVSNGEIDPSAFYFDNDQKKLYLHRSFDNRGITPAILRREIERFSSNIQHTSDLWKFVK